jgi:energy-coupling factor transporter ATP-binding protein EcfA2
LARTIARETAHEVLLQAQKILVVGPPGSGKTTFSKTIQLLLECPTYHLDDFLWGARWQQVDIQEFVAAQHKLVEADRWIIDGTHFTCIDIRLAQADALCILNLPPTLTLWGFLTRAVRRALGDRQSLPRAIRDDENYRWRPKWDHLVLKMILGFRYAILPVILDLADKHPSLNIVLFEDHKQKYSLFRDLSDVRRGQGEESIVALPD